MFLDEAIVDFMSGKGGSGAVAFHREKHVPRGGPNGADGGKGGDIVLLADRGRRTLYEFKFQQKIHAKNGEHAIGNKRGRDAASIIVKVPVGTVVTDTVTGEPLADLNAHGLKVILCKGGRGGFGNLHYVSSIRQVPNFAQKGEPADHIIAKLELKLLADVGLIGLPNAGKSTLISQISAAKPKIADYPFTTIIPNLGVVKQGEDSFVVADMPGLILGASEGKGLGHQFLKHVERTRVLVHVLDCYPIDESDPVANYKTIEQELKSYSEAVWQRPRIIALNKIDLLPEKNVEELKKEFEQFGYPVFAISAVTSKGTEPLIYSIIEILRQTEGEEAIPIVIPLMHQEDESLWTIERGEDGFIVKGKRIERMVAMTNLENDDSVRYLHRRLNRMGLIQELREAGAEEGDNVQVGECEFSFTDEL
jgi:GTP-binding protein